MCKKEKKEIKQTNKLFFTPHAIFQTLVILFAFALLISICSWFMDSIERRHIRNDAKAALDTTELNIISDFEGLEKMLVYISETVRSMILQGSGFNEVSNYITHITDFMFDDDDYKMYTTGVYGYFDVYGGKFHDGTGWIPQNTFVPADRPWYKSAVNAKGEVGITESYLSIAIGKDTLSFARRIFDDNGSPLGIICLDILLDEIRKLAINMRFAHSGYGLLLNSELKIIAHPDKKICGKTLQEIDDGYLFFVESLRQGIPILEKRVINYKHEASVMFARQIKNGWFIAVVIPENDYFRQMKKMRLTIIILGAVLALLFVALSFRLYMVKKELQEYTADLRLTVRETELYQYLLTGLSIKQIAGKMNLSPSGTNFHIRNLYCKLGIQSRTELFAKHVNKPKEG